ncbi:MAG: minor extracellular serine protease Vpr, partial [Gaiellaceae bacterium]|nr:minor extracellular serine protease Vpr [Gaiellaceae bacterium]
MRRAIPLLVACAALLCAVPAEARLVPVRHAGPRVTHGVLPAHTGAAARVRVIVELGLPPLATRGGRGLYAAVARQKLDVRSSSARAYLRLLERRQSRAAARIQAAIPQARIGRRFQVVLDGLTVSLPAAKLPALLRQSVVTKVFPSVAYTLALDRSPSIIGADALRATTGAGGQGIKIAVVDDGIDESNPFFAPAGFSYPSGFPQGIAAHVTPKVIVARVFPGPNAGAPGRLAVDPDSSFHGTHVAGIAAGISGTTAPAGSDHPAVAGLSGVAPRAWLGNYRVFTIPTPIGHVANTPEIVAAFEAAVKDGMDVVNFSGGGPQIEPRSDALLAAVHAVAAAGVVPVISAGNDRDDFGIGSTGSPGTAPDAISVAAVSNTHVFAAALDVTASDAPSFLKGIPFQGANGESAPTAWSAGQTLVDVGAIAGSDGKPVDRHLCGPPGALDSPSGAIPGGTLNGAIALVDRGICPLDTKARIARVAGATGIVYVDNREGEANVLPVTPAVPGGSISNLDGARLRTYMAEHGGRAAIRVGREHLELETGRSDVITSFSSAGPTAFGHELKPDVSAPGGQILSATLPRINASRFAVFDGTSMAAPHVAGAVALLLQLHPSWTPAQIKSALVSTAGPAYSDTARTLEAPVTLEGGGLAALPRATDPHLFTSPSSLSFGDLSVGSGDATRTLSLHLSDAGNGSGTWQVQLVAQAATPGTALDLPGVVTVAPGGQADVSVTARTAAGSPSGENYGFVVLRNGASTLRVPYLFLADKPLLAAAPVKALLRRQTGDTRGGVSRVDAYRYPVAPFGNQPDRPPMSEDGAEVVYRTAAYRKAVNAGVVVVDEATGARNDPWFLGAKDESTVLGFAGTPIDVNSLTYDYLAPVGAAGAEFPADGRYYVAVDSGRDPFSGRSLAGRYVLRSWVNDVKPPSLQLLTTRVSAGRPTLVFRTLDSQSGVDPQSLAIGYQGFLVAVGSFDRETGLAVFPLPGSVPELTPGSVRARMISSDYQETKNIDTTGVKIMPNTRTSNATMQVVSGAAVDVLVPAPNTCVAKRQRVTVAASSKSKVVSVRFSVDGKRFAVDRSDEQGIWSVRLPTRLAQLRRAYVLTVVA